MREANERRGDDHGVNLCLGTPVRLANRGMLPASQEAARSR
jgi:hypothetical protein